MIKENIICSSFQKSYCYCTDLFAVLAKDRKQELFVNELKLNKEVLQFLCSKAKLLVLLLSLLLDYDLSNLM